MKINQLKFGLAAAITAAVTWIICSILVGILPGAMMNTAVGSMVHVEMNRGAWVITPQGVIFGLVAWSLFAGIFGWLLATIYNLLSRN